MKDNRSNEFLVQMEKIGEFCRDENNSLLWLLFNVGSARGTVYKTSTCNFLLLKAN